MDDPHRSPLLVLELVLEVPRPPVQPDRRRRLHGPPEAFVGRGRAEQGFGLVQQGSRRALGFGAKVLGPCVAPPLDKVRAHALPESKVLGHRVVGEVPPGVVEERERDLRVRGGTARPSSHKVIVHDARVPVVQQRLEVAQLAAELLGLALSRWDTIETKFKHFFKM